MNKLYIFIILLISFSSCVKYQQISFQPADLKSNKRFEKNIERYNVIVHQNEKVGVMRGQTLDGNFIRGEVKTVPHDSIVERPVTKDAIKKHRNDVHIYMNGGESFELKDPPTKEKININFDNVKEIRAYSSNGDKIIGGVLITIGIVLLAFLAVILALFIFIVLMILIFVGAFSNNNSNTNNTSNNTSNNTTGGSNSGSGGSGGSGGSNSGGSNSGGSNSTGSSSGCYIATMAYGDYDHPQVMRLRQFRDEILAKSWLGRNFIRFYYATSPHFVKKTKNLQGLHSFLRKVLDLFIRCLPI